MTTQANAVTELKKLAEKVSIHALIALWANAEVTMVEGRWNVKGSGFECSHQNLAMACRYWALNNGKALEWLEMSDSEKAKARAVAMGR